MKKEKRFRQFMYTQDLDHLKVKSFDKAISKAGAKEYAYILHDKDKNEEGKLIRPHYHAALKFKDAKTVSSVAKSFDDEPQYLEVWKGSINNCYSYMLHETSDAQANPNKFHYDPSEVKANFDFITRIKRIRQNIIVSQKDVKEFIVDYAAEAITKAQLQEKIGIFNFAKNKQLIDKITETLEYKKHQEFLKEFKGQKCKVIWLYGKAGVGKTMIAREVLETNHPNGFWISGSSRDHFQSYQGEEYLILNDMRPRDYEYGELLTLLDPYELDKMAPARYRDKYLNAKAIIITTPYPPLNFYNGMKIRDVKVDTYDQLDRRITSLEITESNKEEMKSKLLKMVK